MAAVSRSKNGFSVRAHIGDAKTLLAFNLSAAQSKNLAGFTIWCQPGDPKKQDGYYLLNSLQFENPADHAQDDSLPANSSLNAPFYKFRWLHVPGTSHQGLEPFYGDYTYTVTPRYFNDKAQMQPLDKSKSVDVTVAVTPFKKGAVSLGFTRGFTQSQAFSHRFGKDALIQPANRDPVRGLTFDTSVQAGVNNNGEKFTFADEYGWSGFTARARIFEILDAVAKDRSLSLDVFAYDLNEPDLCDALLKLAGQGRLRMILDNSSIHHTKPGQMIKVKGKSKPKAKCLEDTFEKQFDKKKTGQSEILRGHFARYSHDKVFIVSKGKGDAKKAKTVMTGSTNFSVTGMYVNSNHVLVFSDAKAAGTYLALFNEAWADATSAAKFNKTVFSIKDYAFKSDNVPKMSISFAPHSKDRALAVLKGVSDRIGKEAKSKGNVLFAVMNVDGSDSTVYKALSTINKNKAVYSYGISDTTKGIALYKSGQNGGVLVTGKPTSSILPAPFDQVRSIGGVGHQVHHKFVVCGLGGKDPVVYCGSSNLASGGENQNGDNLLEIHDADIATVFAIEALSLVDHFDFLDKYATKKAGKKKSAKAAVAKKKMPVSKAQAAQSAHWYLNTDDKWTKSYFTKGDLHYKDRELFA